MVETWGGGMWNLLQAIITTEINNKRIKDKLTGLLFVVECYVERVYVASAAVACLRGDELGESGLAQPPKTILITEARWEL